MDTVNIIIALSWSYNVVWFLWMLSDYQIIHSVLFITFWLCYFYIRALNILLLWINLFTMLWVLWTGQTLQRVHMVSFCNLIGTARARCKKSTTSFPDVTSFPCLWGESLVTRLTVTYHAYMHTVRHFSCQMWFTHKVRSMWLPHISVCQIVPSLLHLLSCTVHYFQVPKQLHKLW